MDLYGIHSIEYESPSFVSLSSIWLSIRHSNCWIIRGGYPPTIKSGFLQVCWVRCSLFIIILPWPDNRNTYTQLISQTVNNFWSSQKCSKSYEILAVPIWVLLMGCHGYLTLKIPWRSTCLQRDWHRHLAGHRTLQRRREKYRCRKAAEAGGLFGWGSATEKVDGGFALMKWIQMMFQLVNIFETYVMY